MTETLRSCIISDPGYTFVALDAKQIELRVIANLSQDPVMLQDCRTKDLHLAFAIRILGQATVDEAPFNVDAEKWVKDTMKARRYQAKQGKFALVYDADENKLAEMMDCTIEEALDFMREDRESYPVMYAWKEGEIVKARERGYAVNMFGRIRPLPDLNSGNWRVREAAEREVVNTEVQGSAVDIVKLAMLVLRRDLLDPSVRMVLQVHDEVLLEVPDPLLEATISNSRELIHYFPDYPFSCAYGRVYGEMVELEE